MARSAVPSGMLSSPKRWTLFLGLAIAATSLFAAPVRSEVPCDFKGVSVGDKLSRDQLMQRFKGGVVYAIEMSFNTIFWNDVWGIITKKYGPAWDIERDTMVVMEWETKKTDQFERVIATHKLGGTNPQTRDTCSLSATNIDIIFRHHDSLGTLHALFAIKREPKDF